MTYEQGRGGHIVVANPGGYSTSVSITAASGRAITVYTDTARTASVAMPDTITITKQYYLDRDDAYVISAKVNSVECGVVGTNITPVTQLVGGDTTEWINVDRELAQGAAAGGGGTGGALPIGRYLYAVPNSNGGAAMTKGTEFCLPLALPGSGTLASVAVYLYQLSTDVGAVLRLGVRADNAGVPGAVLTETSFSADTATGTSSWKELSGLTAPYGAAFVWVSVLGQGWNTVAPQITGFGSTPASPSFIPAGAGASRAALDWSFGQLNLSSTVAGNTAGTIASAGPPTGSTVQTLVSTIAVKRGT